MAEDPAVEKLSAGLLELYQSPLQKLKIELDELNKKQGNLCSQLHDESVKFHGLDPGEELKKTFLMMKVYQTRLENVKKEMFSLQDRAKKLKKRALRLQQMKEKEALEREIRKESNQLREQDLIAKPGSSS
ncbi:unnamed protein product [Bemisia tabaci]|uniref:Biogenesis of lysosome-related organelles complex 1 subunit 6 n=1 Tax=Bemisia tabaci TaxID=7038 RepID=A0A9P0A6T0_BEMTA|nr:PREDICTED: biogenesis of lysosome-related organelles complex 1 subunit 6-like [Bemisia tabaci]CAH0385413.1 unnamed protein product [Bemisia tabaci]